MAISYVTYNQQNGSSGSLTATLPQAASVGDLLVAWLNWGGTTSNVFPPTLSDSFNSGSWQIPAAGHFYDATSNNESIVAYIVCDHSAAANYTVTASGLGTQGTNFAVIQYTGFTGTPTFVAADTNFNHGVGTSLAATTINNSDANEVVICCARQGNQNYAGSTGTINNTRSNAAGLLGLFDLINSTSGNSQSWALTIGGSQSWTVALTGFFDGPTSSLMGAASL